ncbi:hypothetical protein DFP72DRAFT_1043934 [Ephemerocybe angulata]|uniref:Uncharacterized protein n=1 Tax=Ephemerocybe angulata TaxID=980116 RepID=A0A8H6I398_9AGAR|nr:hypothetical protein DFP72DRAFT_1043934 [Tulosesus angulatus]
MSEPASITHQNTTKLKRRKAKRKRPAGSRYLWYSGWELSPFDFKQIVCSVPKMKWRLALRCHKGEVTLPFAKYDKRQSRWPMRKKPADFPQTRRAQQTLPKWFPTATSITTSHLLSTSSIAMLKILDPRHLLASSSPTDSMTDTSHHEDDRRLDNAGSPEGTETREPLHTEGSLRSGLVAAAVHPPPFVTTAHVGGAMSAASDTTPGSPSLSGHVEAPQDLPHEPPIRLPPAVDQVIGNRDLLCHIFSNFLPVDAGPQLLGPTERRMLGRLAVTCPAFANPALDCLWRCLASLVPLIRLIPTVQCIDGVYYIADVSSSSPEVNHSSLGPLKNYAKRVRVIEVAEVTLSRNTATIDATVYLLLSQALGRTALLPGLVSITLDFIYPGFPLHSLPLLFPGTAAHPALTHVSISGPAFNAKVFQRIGLPLLASRTMETLKHLEISWHPSTTGVQGVDDKFWENVVVFKHLKSLRIYLPTCEVPKPFLCVLGKRVVSLQNLTLDVRLPTARILSPRSPSSSAVVLRPKKKKGRQLVDSTSRDTVEALPDESVWSIDSNLFPNLRYLSISNRNDTNVFLCQSIPSVATNITHLVLYVNETIMSTLSATVEHLEKCCSLQKLELQERAVASSIVGTETRISLSHTLHPFLSQLTLDELVINVSAFRDPVEFTNDTDTAEDLLSRIFVAASGLQEVPKPLQSLTLPRKWGTSQIPLKALVTASQHAPDLQNLTISIDSSPSCLPAITSKPLIPRPSALRHLQVRDYRDVNRFPFTARDYKSISEYLDECFPDLVRVGVVSTALGDREAWDFINYFRQLLQDKRRQRSS